MEAFVGTYSRIPFSNFQIAEFSDQKEYFNVIPNVNFLKSSVK